MRILSLDLASVSVWATNIGGRRSGTITFDFKRGESPGMRFLRCRAWLSELYRLLGEEIDVICYEQAHHRGGAARTKGWNPKDDNEANAQLLIEFAESDCGVKYLL